MFPVSSRVFRWLLPLALGCLLPISGSLATTTTTDQTTGSKTPETVNPLDAIPDDAPAPLNAFEIDSSFVGDSDFKEKRFDGAGAGRAVEYHGIDEVENSIEIDRRIHLVDRFYLKLGVKWDRFDFATTNAPIPSTLQSLHAIVGLEYVVKGEPAVFFYVNPGVFLSHFSDVNLGSVDAPVDAATALPVPFFHNVFGLAGVHVSALSKNVVNPILGLVWLINDRLTLMGTPPEPRLIYKVDDHFSTFVGGELLGEAYKTSYRNNLRPQEQRFNGAVLDYSEDRVGAGLTYNFNKALNVDFSGGCSLERSFDYYRPSASKRFISDPAPYAKLEISAEF